MRRPTPLGPLGRRDMLRGAAALVALGPVALTLRPAHATPEQAAAALRDLIGDRTPQEGRITLSMPPIAENGNTVPVTVAVDSPMTEADHVKAIHILSEENPEPTVVSISLTPQAGRAELSTRMRMAKSQKVWAVAEMSDGSAWMTRTEVKVTISGCVG